MQTVYIVTSRLNWIYTVCTEIVFDLPCYKGLTFDEVYTNVSSGCLPILLSEAGKQKLTLVMMNKLRFDAHF